MNTLRAVVQYLNQLLPPHEFKDSSQNGLQVEGDDPDSPVTRVALAVDAGESVIARACEQENTLLIVHHGMFWDKPVKISGISGRKVRHFMESSCSLYASHLPLDAHPHLGNNAQIADQLELIERVAFFEYLGQPIGVRGSLSKPIAPSEIARRCESWVGCSRPLLLPFGAQQVRTIGIVSGSAAAGVAAAAEAGLDLYLSGEPKQEVYHACKELGLNAIFAGHYATETFGVMAVGRELEKHFKLPTIFLHEPTGI